MAVNTNTRKYLRIPTGHLFCLRYKSSSITWNGHIAKNWPEISTALHFWCQLFRSVPWFAFARTLFVRRKKIVLNHLNMDFMIATRLSQRIGSFRSTNSICNEMFAEICLHWSPTSIQHDIKMKFQSKIQFDDVSALKPSLERFVDTEPSQWRTTNTKKRNNEEIKNAKIIKSTEPDTARRPEMIVDESLPLLVKPFLVTIYIYKAWQIRVGAESWAVAKWAVRATLST